MKCPKTCQVKLDDSSSMKLVPAVHDWQKARHWQESDASVFASYKGQVRVVDHGAPKNGAMPSSSQKSDQRGGAVYSHNLIRRLCVGWHGGVRLIIRRTKTR